MASKRTPKSSQKLNSQKLNWDEKSLTTAIVGRGVTISLLPDLRLNALFDEMMSVLLRFDDVSKKAMKKASTLARLC
ncbi:hypothetical protein CGT80_03135 [Vibrio cholerae]|nr:hypothetical protein CGT80_03135 [Vibrio cholerae]